MTSSLNTSLSQKVVLPDAEAYAFDIDGTLLVTQDLVHWNALHQAMLEVYGVETTIAGIPYHGMTDLLILRAAIEREGIKNDVFDRLLPRALHVVRREVERHHADISPRVCPGITSLLQFLQRGGKLMGVASGNLESVGWHKIEAAGLRPFFSFGFFSDDCERRSDIFRNVVEHVCRELGANTRTCFLGDTPSDIRAARDVGAQIVAVATGTFSKDDLSACLPDMCLSTVDGCVMHS